MKRSIRSLFLAAALTTVSYAAAFAEVTYNRGNSADPESLDPHKTSTVYEAHVLRDLFTGLTAQDAKANVIPGAAESSLQTSARPGALIPARPPRTQCCSSKAFRMIFRGMTSPNGML